MSRASTFSDWLEAIRPRTLPVSVAGVIAAGGIAAFEGCFKITPWLLCLAFAVLAQIVSNLANEYYDFKHGLDHKGRVGPHRGVTEGSIKPATMKRVTYGLLLLDGAIGCCLIPFGGWWLIGVGAFIAIFALAYSAGPYPLSSHGLGDVAVLLFFGVIPVNFTFYVQAGHFSMYALWTSVAVGLLGTNVLVVNNYRDYDDDLAVGKRTTIVMFGRAFGRWFYLFNIIAAMAAETLLLPLIGEKALIAVETVTLVNVVTWLKLCRRDGAALNPLLGTTSLGLLVVAFSLAIASALVGYFA